VLLEEVRYVTMETAACLCCNNISNYIMFTLTLNTDTQGVIGVTRGGQVSYHGDSSLPLVPLLLVCLFNVDVNMI
jgi:lipoate-protein ligase B